MKIMDIEQEKIIKHIGHIRTQMRILMEDFKPWEKKILITKQEYELFIGASEQFQELNKRLIKMGDEECYLGPWNKKCRATNFFKCISCNNTKGN